MNSHKDINRREFLYRSLKAGISVALAGAASYLLYDPDEPAPGRNLPKLVALPDFSIRPSNGKTICAARGADRKKNLAAAIEALGGIGRFVRPGETVAIKPNAAFATSAEICATTHPDIIAELVRICRGAGAKRVIVIDNPINDPASCFYLSGIERAARESGADIIMPGPEQFRSVTLKNGRLIRGWPVLSEPILKADRLIGIAPVKSHHRSGASMSMKNWYGLLGGRRNIFHQDIHLIIAELAQLVKPTLVILDGTQVMMTNGPTGGSLSDLKRMDTIIASCDQVAADSLGAGLLNMKISDLPYIAMAEQAGAGTSDYKSLKPVFINAS
jgi:uncharacterized protein (DUF362 family)